MNEERDWYPTTQVDERLMYANVDAKIDNYQAKYQFLAGDLVDRVQAACRTFVEAYDKIEYNRSTGKQATRWFENLMTGVPQDKTALAFS